MSELETYDYVGDRVVSIEQRFHDPSAPGKPTVWRLDISYDTRGDLESIVERGGGTVVFRS